jgi:GntR family transcriptional regulator/MocR family aminotransferase
MLRDDSDLPIYRQIYETIRKAILGGKFFPTMPLPASRLLAKQLNVSRMTVVNAYDLLMAEGYVESKTGAGTFVAAHLPEEFLQTPDLNQQPERYDPSPRKIDFSAYGRRLAEGHAEILHHHGPTSFVPFQQGVPAIEQFPFDVWGKIAQKWARKPSLSLHGYNSSFGFKALREAVSAYLESARGVRCGPEQVIITNGTQQGLDLIGRVFLDDDREVWIEDPCYFGARDVFAALGARLIPVPIDKEGLDLVTARKKSKSARLVYVTPSHQYPLGITMSLARRMNLLEWARETGSFVIEDDYNSEFRYAGRPLASLQGLDREGRVIYLGTFSKTVFPSLRLGCLVVPPDLVDIFGAARAVSDLHSPSVDQAILAEFISERHFSRHIRRMRSLYEERQQTLVAEAKKHLRGMLDVPPAESGMHLIGWLPAGVDDGEVSRRAAEENLRISPISELCIEERLRGGLFLGYTTFGEKQIKAGVKTLARVLREFV